MLRGYLGFISGQGHQHRPGRTTKWNGCASGNDGKERRNLSRTKYLKAEVMARLCASRTWDQRRAFERKSSSGTDGRLRLPPGFCTEQLSFVHCWCLFESLNSDGSSRCPSTIEPGLLQCTWARDRPSAASSHETCYHSPVQRGLRRLPLACRLRSPRQNFTDAVLVSRGRAAPVP
jgi:hypothetical protein